MSEAVRFLLFRAVFFMIYAPIGITFPFFVLYLKNEVGFTGREISYITGISGVTVILFQQLWGYAGDVLVSKKHLVIANTLGAGLLFLGLAELRSFWAILALSFLFHTLFSSTNQLLHGFLFTHQGGEQRFGALRAYASLGFIVANIAVGSIADEVTGGKLGFIFPAFFAACACSVLLLIPIPERMKAPAERPSFLKVQAHFLRQRNIRLFLLLAFVYQAAHSLSYIMQSVLLDSLGAERSVIAVCYSVAALLELPIFFSANRLRARFGDPGLLAFAAAVQTIRWLLVWQAETPGEIILISMSHCITYGLFYAAAVGYMNSHAGPDYKASAQTMFAFVYMGLAHVAGNFAGGQILDKGWLQPYMSYLVRDLLQMRDRGDLRNLYVFCSGLAAVALGIALALWRLERRRQSEQPTEA